MRRNKADASISSLAPLLCAHARVYEVKQTTPYACNGLTAYRERPLAAAAPETEAQSASVLNACYRPGVPVVARGAGSAPSGASRMTPR